MQSHTNILSWQWRSKDNFYVRWNKDFHFKSHEGVSYFIWKTSKWTQRLKFTERRQQPEDSVESFTSDLHQIASKCKFDALVLMDSLQGQFIMGVSDDCLREKLLLHDDNTLAFQVAVDCAKEFESKTGQLGFPTCQITWGQPRTCTRLPSKNHNLLKKLVSDAVQKPFSLVF